MSERADERTTHTAFWHALSDDSTYGSPAQKMLLMADADAAARDDKEDLRELLALLPPLRPAARVLELAAGNGRVTPHLARRAGWLLACDFVPAFCQQNREICRGLGLNHVEVVCGDAVHMTLPSRLDLVFANWLLMYLSDAEVRDVLQRAALALAPGGYLLFRESCDTTDEGLDHVWPPYQPDNPARYRSLRWYTEALAALPVPGGLLRPVDILPLWSPPEWSTLQAAWLWQRAPTAAEAPP